MTSRSAAEDDAIAAAIDCKGAKIVADVGGGQGSLLRAVLRAHPHMSGILFDRPEVVEMARSRFAGGTAERCEFVAGDFLGKVPVRADIVLMKRIIHDWDDERSRAILRNCRAATSDGGKLVLIERLLRPGRRLFHGEAHGLADDGRNTARTRAERGGIRRLVRLDRIPGWWGWFRPLPEWTWSPRSRPDAAASSIEQARHRFFQRRARNRFAEEVAIETMRMFGASSTACVASIVSVVTSSLSFEPVIRATAPPESTPCVM